MKVCAIVLLMLIFAGVSSASEGAARMLDSAKEIGATDRAEAILLLEEILIGQAASDVREEATHLLVELRYVAAVEGITKAFIREYPARIEISPKHLQELIDIVADFPGNRYSEEIVAKIVICQLINRVFPSVLDFQEKATSLAVDGQASLRREEFQQAATFHSAISGLINEILVPAFKEVAIELAKIPSGGQREHIYQKGISLVEALRDYTLSVARLYSEHAEFLRNDAEDCSSLFWEKKNTPQARRCESIQRGLHARSGELDEVSRRNELELNELLLASDKAESQYLFGIFSFINALRI